jgi:hypothetical protein
VAPAPFVHTSPGTAHLFQHFKDQKEDELVYEVEQKSKIVNMKNKDEKNVCISS